MDDLAKILEANEREEKAEAEAARKAEMSVRPVVGMKLWAREKWDVQEEVELMIPEKMYGKDCEIISISKDGLFIELKFDMENPDDKMNRCIFSFVNKETTLETFWTTFYLLKNQGNCYDPDDIWIAGDGDGGFYAYDSEEAALDYCYKNDEDGPWNVGRSTLESKAAEMFVLLRHLAKGESSPDIQKRIKKVVKEVSAADGTAAILKAQGLA